MNVLLLTDFSNNACVAHKYVFNLLKNQRVNYYLVHALNFEQFNNNQPNKSFAYSENLEHNFNQLNNFTPPSSTLSRVEETGNLLDVVRTLIHQLDVQLVVMGAKGQSTQTKINLGKNTYEISTKVKCPVLIVPENTKIKTPIKVNFPIDYNDRIHTNCISKIQNLPNWENMKIAIQEINTSEVDAVNQNSYEVLTDTLQLVQPTFIPTFLVDLAQLSQNSDIIFLAAKNLKICESIFNQMSQGNGIEIKPTPLLVLHA